MNVLFVEPDFPIPAKSKNHSNFLPIGLLKLASFYRNKGCNIKLNRGNELAGFYPNRIYITSLFTYWASYVKDAVTFYKKKYPKSKIIVGGVYATLMPEHCKEYTGCNEVFTGQHKAADKCLPAYDLVDVDYQIIHGMRGCLRKCPFCGIWKIEKKSFKTAKEIQKEICKNKIIFYDNNMLVNPNIKEILAMLSNATYNNRPVTCECQSGFDGRVLQKNPELAIMLKKARFKNIRVAWDFAFEQYEQVENWINILETAGYKRSDIFIFMVYNWSFDYSELEAKRQKCFKWGVQIADCRFRPLNQTYDNYNSQVKQQTSNDYYIHSNWSDQHNRQFRRDVRKHNICIRHRIAWND
ncbi:MAG: Fe-S oxidoreductase, partial [Bacteroidales bacterium]